MLPAPLTIQYIHMLPYSFPLKDAVLPKIEVQQIFSIKGTMVSILGFASHICLYRQRTRRPSGRSELGRPERQGLGDGQTRQNMVADGIGGVGIGRVVRARWPAAS